MLNSPLNLSGATAVEVANGLKEHEFESKVFICKTGTLDERDLNLCIAFGISNKNFTITVLIDGIQLENEDKKSAKYLFIKLIPEIFEYLK